MGAGQSGGLMDIHLMSPNGRIQSEVCPPDHVHSAFRCTHTHTQNTSKEPVKTGSSLMEASSLPPKII